MEAQQAIRPLKGDQETEVPEVERRAELHGVALAADLELFAIVSGEGRPVPRVPVAEGAARRQGQEQQDCDVESPHGVTVATWSMTRWESSNWSAAERLRTPSSR